VAFDLLLDGSFHALLVFVDELVGIKPRGLEPTTLKESDIAGLISETRKSTGKLQRHPHHRVLLVSWSGQSPVSMQSG